MRKTVLYLGISLDGFVAGPDDDLSWLNPFKEVDYEYDKFFSGIGAIIVGRCTYDIMVQEAWENACPVPEFVVSHRS